MRAKLSVVWFLWWNLFFFFLIHVVNMKLQLSDYNNASRFKNLKPDPAHWGAVGFSNKHDNDKIPPSQQSIWIWIMSARWKCRLITISSFCSHVVQILIYRKKKKKHGWRTALRSWNGARFLLFCITRMSWKKKKERRCLILDTKPLKNVKQRVSRGDPPPAVLWCISIALAWRRETSVV